LTQQALPKSANLKTLGGTNFSAGVDGTEGVTDMLLATLLTRERDPTGVELPDDARLSWLDEVMSETPDIPLPIKISVQLYCCCVSYAASSVVEFSSMAPFFLSLAFRRFFWLLVRVAVFGAVAAAAAAAAADDDDEAAGPAGDLISTCLAARQTRQFFFLQKFSLIFFFYPFSPAEQPESRFPRG